MLGRITAFFIAACTFASLSLVQAADLNTTPAPLPAAPLVASSPFAGFEARFGGVAHSVLHNTEQSADISIEFLSPRYGVSSGNPLLDFVIRPRIAVGGNINLDRFRNQVYGGFVWTYDFTDRLAFELGWSALVHDGRNLPPPNANELALGCSVLFRESFAFTYKFADNWKIIASFEHGSNAGLCRRNVGINTAGVKIGYVF